MLCFYHVKTLPIFLFSNALSVGHDDNKHLPGMADEASPSDDPMSLLGGYQCAVNI
jgi:hypothetical protein